MFNENHSLEQAREVNKQETLLKLREYQKKIDIWGHGVTRREVADSILEEGLHTELNGLHHFSHRLPENSDQMAHMLRGWDYEGRRTIVLIAAPKGFEATDVGGYGSYQKSKEETQKYIFKTKEDEKEKNVIPSEKILGYVDVDSFKFFENHQFSL